MVCLLLLECQQWFEQMLLHLHLNHLQLHHLLPQQLQNLNVRCHLEKQPLHQLQRQQDEFELQLKCKPEILLLDQYVVQAQPTNLVYVFLQPFRVLCFSQLGEQTMPYEVQFELGLHLRSEQHHSFQFHAYSGCKYPRFA